MKGQTSGLGVRVCGRDLRHPSRCHAAKRPVCGSTKPPSFQTNTSPLVFQRISFQPDRRIRKGRGPVRGKAHPGDMRGKHRRCEGGPSPNQTWRARGLPTRDCRGGPGRPLRNDREKARHRGGAQRLRRSRPAKASVLATSYPAISVLQGPDFSALPPLHGPPGRWPVRYCSPAQPASG